MTEKKIGFVGTDGRTLLAALETSRSKSELYPGAYRGVVVKGTGAMEPFAKKMGWPVDFIPVPDNSAPAYAAALIQAFEDGEPGRGPGDAGGPAVRGPGGPGERGRVRGPDHRLYRRGGGV